jgi:hypothetical protein
LVADGLRKIEASEKTLQARQVFHRHRHAGGSKIQGAAIAFGKQKKAQGVRRVDIQKIAQGLEPSP